MIRIADPEDARIQHYRAVRDRDIAGRGGRFVAEGEVVIRALLGGRSRFRAESLLLSEARAEALAREPGLLPTGTPVYVAGQRVMDAVVGFHIHRGALAIGLRGEPAEAGQLLSRLPETALVLALVGLSNHDNVGAAFRNAAAFGADAVLLDRATCDPLYRKALRVSVGASLLVPFARLETADAVIGALEQADCVPVALSPSGTACLEGTSWPARTALLVGAEGPGLPASLVARLRSVRIGMASGFDSLNVATAAGIALHAVHAARNRPAGD